MISCLYILFKMIALKTRLRAMREVLGLGDPRRLLGLSFILAVAVIWVVASFVVQDIESTGAHPAVLTCVANSLFAVFLPIYWLNLRIKRHRAAAAGQQEPRLLFAGEALRSDDVAGMPQDTTSGAPAPLEMSRQQLFKAALVVAPLWFLAQLTFNASLELTSVTSNTILSSASALFTFMFSVALLSERFTLPKLGCIALLIAGTAMVTLSDSASAGGGGDSTGSHSVAGDMLCLASAVVYGAYTVALRRLLTEDEGVAMTLFFGFMGGIILGVVGPLLIVLRLLGVDLGVLTWRGFWLMVAKGLLDNVLSDYLWARAILLVGPTLATSGLSMQVPIAVTLDAVFGQPAWLQAGGRAALTFIGGAVVLAGFFGMNMEEAGEEEKQGELSSGQQ